MWVQKLARSEGFEQTDSGQNVAAFGQFSDARMVDSMVVVLTSDNLQLLQRMSNDVTVIISRPSSGRKPMNAGFLKSWLMGVGA